MSLAPPQPGMGMGGNGPSGTGGIMDSIRGFMGNAAPDQQGRGGLLKALGLNPDQANRMRASLGAGLSAAGNSAGKTGMQAFASGMGAALEGGTKEMHKNTEQAQGYLAKAIAAQKQGDDAAYNTNYLRYLIASNQAKYADGKNKNDSPTQLFLAAQRNLNDDPAVKAARVQLENAAKNNVPQKELAALQANFQTIMTERQTYHLKGVGLTPEAAAEIKQQPGNTVQNPVKPDGLNEKNIGTILKPGQFYWSPSEKHLPPDQRTVYVYKGKKGEAVSSSKADETPPSRTLPSNKRKPSDVPMPSDDGSED